MDSKQKIANGFKYALIISLGPLIFPLIEGAGFLSIFRLYMIFVLFNTGIIAFLILPIWESLKKDQQKNNTIKKEE